jgi:hypothetical protein
MGIVQAVYEYAPQAPHRETGLAVAAASAIRLADGLRAVLYYLGFRAFATIADFFVCRRFDSILHHG